MLSNLQVQKKLGNIPYMTLKQADRMTCLIEEYKLKDVLELGFYHGVSTAYIANAVSQFDGASVVAIDKERGRAMQPNIEELLNRVGQRDMVEIHYEKTSYLWRLMKFLERDACPKFDLCYIDGAHNWFVDGFAFFLVDKLLKPGGWIIFDDLEFSYSSSQAMRGTETLAQMPQEERECPQVRKVYELLVKTQPGYGNFREEDNWAFAQKTSTEIATRPEFTKEVIVRERHIGLGAALIKLGRRIGFR